MINEIIKISVIHLNGSTPYIIPLSDPIANMIELMDYYNKYKNFYFNFKYHITQYQALSIKMQRRVFNHFKIPANTVVFADNEIIVEKLLKLKAFI